MASVKVSPTTQAVLAVAGVSLLVATLWAASLLARALLAALRPAEAK
jgi:hypothetical protein